MPSIHFFLANTEHPVDSNHPLWHQPLPARSVSAHPASAGHESVSLTYGDYFKAVSEFCSANGWEAIVRAITQKWQRLVDKENLSQVSIFLEKHGALYHPARVLVNALDQTQVFVINVAASTEGRRTLPVEMKALERLGDQRPFGWLPTVYGASFDRPPMFMADWFDGYHEFHLTRQPGKKDLSLIVWDGTHRPHLLSKRQTAELYRQATMILTACYDPITTDQIFPWHHAAGDFVIRVKENAVDVKLITARNYTPFSALATTSTDERALLDNMILFFIHLSVRMRLDRIDGVSEIVWAPEECLTPMIDGFFKGMDLTSRLSGFPETFPSLFQSYFNHQDPPKLMKMAEQMAETVFARQSEEDRVIATELERHVNQISRRIKDRKSA